MRAGPVAILVLTIASCTATPPVVAAPTPSPTREPGTIAVTALLDLSGSRGPKGDAQRGADGVVAGVRGMAAETWTAAVGLLGRPVLFTLPLAEPSGPGARWMFGLAPAPDAVARALVDALPSRSSPAAVVVAGTLVSGREELALASTFRGDARPMPVLLSAAPDQRDPFMQRVRQLASGGTPIYYTGPTLGYLEPQRLLPDAGTAALLPSYLTDANDAARLGDATASARWPALRKTIGSALGTHAASATDALGLIAASVDPSRDPGPPPHPLQAAPFPRLPPPHPSPPA